MVGFPDRLSVIANVTDSYWIRRHRTALIAFRFVAVLRLPPSPLQGVLWSLRFAGQCRPRYRADVVMLLRVTFSRLVDQTPTLFYTPFTRYSRLSNRLYNRFDNRLNVCLHDAAGCSTAVVKPHNRLNNRLDNRLDNRLYRVNGTLR